MGSHCSGLQSRLPTETVTFWVHVTTGPFCLERCRLISLPVAPHPPNCQMSHQIGQALSTFVIRRLSPCRFASAPHECGAWRYCSSPLPVSLRTWSTRASGNSELEVKVLSRNRKWASDIEREKPGFLAGLQLQQKPDYLWIGCSDSRVPANVIVGMDPGELFVHRNVANLVVQTDMNCLSVLQYAVDLLKVKHIMVVGHYGCGGVRAALENKNNGLIDNWLRHIQSIARFQSRELKRYADDQTAIVNRLCELNVIRQTLNVGQTTVIQDAWGRNQDVSIHGLIYGLHDGLLHDLRATCTSRDDVDGFEELYCRRAYDPTTFASPALSSLQLHTVHQ
jgi:carbonic anhydrase